LISMRSCLGTSNISKIAPWVHGAFTLKPLDLQIVALPSNQVILAEPSISRLLKYVMNSKKVN
ncbi:hypothetical protein ACPV3U_20885, partial [Vibrio rotiferianus]|uniref:hypothetical protein n=1 Tax=Vibrio rotiferianus TaxID=190895 RepID=UPI00406A15F1